MCLRRGNGRSTRHLERGRVEGDGDLYLSTVILFGS